MEQCNDWSGAPGYSSGSDHHCYRVIACPVCHVVPVVSTSAAGTFFVWCRDVKCLCTLIVISRERNGMEDLWNQIVTEYQDKKSKALEKKNSTGALELE